MVGSVVFASASAVEVFPSYCCSVSLVVDDSLVWSMCSGSSLYVD